MCHDASNYNVTFTVPGFGWRVTISDRGRHPSRKGSVMSTSQIIRAYGAAWNEADEGERRKLLEGVMVG